MATLLLTDRGSDVFTSAWSAGSNQQGDRFEISYLWGRYFGWDDGTAGMRRITLAMSREDFADLIAKGGLVDIRQFQVPPLKVFGVRLSGG